MPTSALTAFSFGYWGSARATDRLVHAVDAAEHVRGFQPPRWVDIRVRREVSATGFRADALESLLGSRYVWMPELGNVAVQGDGGVSVRSAEAVERLLALIQSDSRQRVIFFCACEMAGHCHRRSVSKLLVRAAGRHGARLVVMEWPGGEPEQRQFPATPHELARAARNQLERIPIPGSISHASAVVIPWGSVAQLNHEDVQAFALIGPACFGTHGAYLPVMRAGTSSETLQAEVPAWLEKNGFTALSTPEHHAAATFDIHDLTVEQVLAAVHKVSGGGPLSEIELLRRVSRELGAQRFGARMQRELKAHVRTALCRGILVRDGKLLLRGSSIPTSR